MAKETKITSIGGQAVIEGVMMRGPFKTATAVRKPDGEIECKIDEIGTKKRNWFLKLPIVRGCVNFIDSLVIGNGGFERGVIAADHIISMNMNAGSVEVLPLFYGFADTLIGIQDA